MGPSVLNDIIHRQIVEKGTIIDSKNKIKKKPALKPYYKLQSMLWARNHMSYGHKWQSVIFSDEKSGIWMVKMAFRWLVSLYWHYLWKET